MNPPGGDYFLIAVPEAPVTTERWVSAACGVRVVEPGGQADGSTSGRRRSPAGDESTENLLVLSWQPAFCETMSRTAECRALNDGGLPAAATRLSIHGLWAQPESRAYCDVPAALVELDQEGRWSRAAAGRARRRRPRPAPCRDARHRERPRPARMAEARHLSPRADGADGYFDDMLSLADAINASPVAAFLADRVGAKVRAAEIRAAFDAAFGAGAGARVAGRIAPTTVAGR